MAKKKSADERNDSEVLHEGGSRVYELGFHLDPDLPTEEVKKAYQGIRSFIEKKGTVVAEGEPLPVQLAYTISRMERSGSGRRDFTTAQFAWIAYETSAENHADVLSAIDENDRVIRFIDVVTSKEAARHAAELRELALEAPVSAEEPEAASEAELDAALENATA